MPYVYRRGEDIERLPTAPYVFREEDAPITEIRRYLRNYRPELCGTTKGYMQHRRYKEPQCDDCKAAQARQSAIDRNKRKESTSGLVQSG